MNLFERVKNILITPKTEWELINTGQVTKSELVFKYLLPLIIISPISRFISKTCFGISLGPQGILKLTIGWGLLYGLVLLFLYLLAIYALSYILESLCLTFGSNKINNSFKIIVYAFTPFFLSEVFRIHPSLEILSLIGIYSFYLLYLGIDIIKGINSDKLPGLIMVFGLISVVIFWLIELISSFILAKGFVLN